MRIKGISFKYPNHSLTNQDILDLVAARSAGTYKQNIDKLLDNVNDLFQHSGIENRHTLKPGEPWYPAVQSVVEEALDQAGLDPRDIDCLIYPSIYKPVLEPSMASLLAKSLQMDTAAAFDINEACAGWARSVMLSQDMLHSGQYRHILVVTNEAFVPGFSYGAGAFELKEAADLDWAFATYTIGSGATATILSSDGPRWDIRHFSDNRRAEDCLFPAQWPKPHEHSMGSVNSAGQGPDVFTCYGRKIQLASIRSISRFLKDQRETILSSNLFIPHTQTYRAYLDLLKLVQAERDIYSLFPQFGNIITSSLPASLAHARNHGYLKEGDSVFMLIPASGLSVFTLHFCDGGL